MTALIQDAHAFLATAVQFVRDWKGDPACKVILILDSVERIRGIGDDAMKVFDSVRNLFFSFGDSLRIPMLHVVYTVPPYLSIIAAGAGMTLGGATTYRLVSTHIFKDRSRDIDDSGLALLRKVVAKRFGGWAMVFQSAALDRLAINSGGDLREFFRLIRFCLAAVRNDSDLPLSTDNVKKAENEGRREFLPLPADHLVWLKRISVSKDIELDEESRLPTLAHFLDVRLVLNYKNGSDWYDVHPLLRDVIDAYVPANTGS